MAGPVDSPAVSYISPHSADVILSEIRPIKLNIEALNSINVLLDEFLYSILKAASSLSTDKLRASLLTLLPTALGKEALLEAEVELRAYWDRTAPADAAVLEDDSKTFHLQWAFELLRLKCEAYSTLNESEEDHTAEGRINDRMNAAGGAPPKITLMAPAALYLTAILEALCEHILSNVGRVVARDSSCTSASVQDLFTALCEDDSIYSLFKTMKVYEQIEQLTKTPKVRRSKSFTRNEKSSRTSSPHPDTRSVLSSEGSVMATSNGSTHITNLGARPSFEKTRALKMFKAGSRNSFDDILPTSGHKRSTSLISETSRHTTTQYNDEGSVYEDETLQQEFDDLMRSSSTMKVSLTPDRLKTMEAYKQEKERGNRRQGPSSFKTESDSSSALPPRATGRRPSLLRVDSIKEDDEDSPRSPPLSTTRSRQSSVSSPPTSSPPPDRVRSISTSNPNAAYRALQKISHVVVPPSSIPPAALTSPSMQKTHRIVKGPDPVGFPPRTRKIQRNRESLDLDDVMGGSDNDDEGMPPPKVPAKHIPPKSNGQHVSASTKELMDFLAEGPPDMGGPSPDHSFDGSLMGVTENSKPKGSRLQRMISKISLSAGERSRGVDDLPRSKAYMQPVVRTSPTIPPKGPLNNVSSLGNRPIPPRPRPISPPVSPQDSSDEQTQRSSRSRSASLVQSKRVSPPEPTYVEPIPAVPMQREHSENASSSRRSQHTNGHSPHRNRTVENATIVTTSRTGVPTKPDSAPPSPVIGEKTTKAQHRQHVISPPSARKPPPVYVDANSKPHLSVTDAQDMHRLFARSTTADECRLILDMFLAKSGISIKPTNYDVPYPSPSPSVIKRDHTSPVDPLLENTLIELLLGGDSVDDSDSQKYQTIRLSPAALAAEVTPSPSNGIANGEFEVVNKEADGADQTALTNVQNHTLVEL